MVTVTASYRSKSIAGDTVGDNERELPDAAAAHAYARGYCEPGLHTVGNMTVDYQPTKDPNIIRWVYTAHWSAIGEPATWAMTVEFLAEEGWF